MDDRLGLERGADGLLVPRLLNNGEIWEEWALTYGRNGLSEKKEKNFSFRACSRHLFTSSRSVRTSAHTSPSTAGHSPVGQAAWEREREREKTS